MGSLRAIPIRRNLCWHGPLSAVLGVVLGFAGCSFPDFAVAPEGSGGDANAGGACEVQPCAACELGTADCNADSADGCETQLDSTENCGACGRACINEHGSTACFSESGSSDAQCTPLCAAGYADCDLDLNNGCETSLNGDVLNCGECGMACPSAGGTPTCVAGQCGVSSCNAGFGDCDNAGACTFNLTKDPQNCGQCGKVCSSAHGTPSCNAGKCETGCDAGFGDCNDDASDGCETKLNVPDSNGNVANCGACGATCNRRAYTTVNLAQCALGVCFRDCMSGAHDCTDNRNDPTCKGSTCGCEYGTCP